MYDHVRFWRCFHLCIFVRLLQKNNCKLKLNLSTAVINGLFEYSVRYAYCMTFHCVGTGSYSYAYLRITYRGIRCLEKRTVYRVSWHRYKISPIVDCEHDDLATVLAIVPLHTLKFCHPKPYYA